MTKQKYVNLSTLYQLCKKVLLLTMYFFSFDKAITQTINKQNYISSRFCSQTLEVPDIPLFQQQKQQQLQQQQQQKRQQQQQTRLVPILPRRSQLGPRHSQGIKRKTSKYKVWH